MYFNDEYRIRREEYAERCYMDFISDPIYGDDDEEEDDDEH